MGETREDLLRKIVEKADAIETDLIALRTSFEEHHRKVRKVIGECKRH